MKYNKNYAKLNIKTLYRIGYLHNNSFFTDDLNYYLFPPFERNSLDATKYLVDMDCKIFDPMNEINLVTIKWDDIRGNNKDFERFKIKNIDGITSTDDIAIAGSNLGVDMTIIRDIPNNDGNGNKFTEYVIHNLNVIVGKIK